MNFTVTDLQRFLLMPISVFSVVVIGGMCCLAIYSDSSSRLFSEVSVQPSQDFSADADLPLGWQVKMTNAQRTGWLQCGEVPLGIMEARTELSSFMERRGFICMQVVDEDVDHAQMLLLYAGPSQKLLWSLRKTDWNRTDFSWGISK